jgi:7-cyano-7-deazaguanine synthase
MKVVAVLSGGLDSTCYAAQWKSRGHDVHPVVFDYGQKGRKEIEVALSLCNKLGFQTPKLLDIRFMRDIWVGTQLTDDKVGVEGKYTPSVVVPIRNAILLTVGTAYAYTIGASYVVYGANTGDIAYSEDTSGPMYPDCSPLFLTALETALNLGHYPMHERKVEMWSPAREGLSKSENLKLGYGIAGDLIYQTWSCYLSGDKQCGRCESCRNRQKAFLEARIPDRTEYAA